MMIGVSEIIAILGAIFGIVFYLIIPLLFLKMVYKLEKFTTFKASNWKELIVSKKN